ncbi:metal ABC transporter permease [Mesorhizobium sp. M1227]|uniref:metal ABC transporter permease n=1 Tax=unclassified Mesorhizobium TaxID=325217 RepID=UPI0033385F65
MKPHHIMNRFLGLALAATASLALATAAGAAALRIRGTVVSVSPSALTVHTASGDVSASLQAKTAFVSVVPSDLSHVETGGYVGVASKSVGNKLIALSVIVFPPALKGASEGHADYDVLPDTTLAGGARTASSMTNANVKTIATPESAPQVNSSTTNGSVATTTANGNVKLLTVTYNGGEQNILIPPTAPIVAFVPGDASIVTPGAAVFVNADQADGKTTAGLVAVGSHGLTPPF